MPKSFEASFRDDAPLVVFPFAVSFPFAHAARLFGVRPEHARLEVSGLRLRAVFGPWAVDSTLDNIEAVEVTGPYSAIKVIGPPRVSIADGGLTFATNADEGICIAFRNPEPGAIPIPWIRHPSLTVTVAEPREVQSFLQRASQELTGTEDDRADQVVAQFEHDSVAGLTSSELRERARVMGVEKAAEMSHDELVTLLTSGHRPV